MAFKMKGNPLKMGSMATKSTMKMAKESAMKMKKESPMEMGHKSPNKMKGKPDKKATNPKRGFEAAGKAAAEGAMTAVAAGKARDLEGQKKLKMTKTVKPANKPKKSAIKLSEEDKKKAMDNAMPDAKVNSRNYDDLKTDKAEMAASKKRLQEAKHRASIGGDPEKKAYDKVKRREAKIQSNLNVAPLKMKKKK